MSNCVNRCQLRTVSDSYLKLVCLLSTSAYSALEVLHIVRYINLLTYLLTYLFTYCENHSTETALLSTEKLKIDRNIIVGRTGVACTFGIGTRTQVTR